MKKFFRILAYVVAGVLVATVLLTVFATLSNYQPEEKTELYNTTEPDIIATWAETDLLIWNIGYCGLNAEMDFFYDGGKMVRPAKDQVQLNLAEVIRYLASNDTVEFFLLQEVDVESKRSFRINIYDSIRATLSAYWSFYGKNYDVFFVPVPPSEPMGKVESGIQTLSSAKPFSSYRHQFPGSFPWPTSLFMLDRCFISNRYKMNNGKELVIINTHNSAYDPGPLKKLEMKYLRKYLLEEYKQGNYVIAGGDWNQCPPGFKPEYEDEVFDTIDFQTIELDFLPGGWTWAYDPSVPSNRRVTTPYVRGTTPATTIDYFLLSPNVQLVSVRCNDLEFKNSDHQPVHLKVLFN